MWVAVGFSLTETYDRYLNRSLVERFYLHLELNEHLDVFYGAPDPKGKY